MTEVPSDRDAIQEPRISPGIIPVHEVLADENLEIPPYQRPYKWTVKNIQQLFFDLVAFKEQPRYRLGAIVFHLDHHGKKNIVDGQQRTITLMLIALAVSNHFAKGGNGAALTLKNQKLARQVETLRGAAQRLNFTNRVSKENIRANYLEILRIVSRPDFREETIEFLFNRCEFVVFNLKHLSEAFQFFDSQNARGKDLEPHDLLKAFHLREFDPREQELKTGAVESWENSATEDLSEVFEDYWYRIRQWASGHRAGDFRKKDVSEFKGFTLEKTPRHPHLEVLRTVHHVVNHHGRQMERAIDGASLPFPFRIDQTVINGRRFFEMTAHYQRMILGVARIPNHLEELLAIKAPVEAGHSAERAAAILEALKIYEGRGRVGDRHVRLMFDCLVIYYIDKFGTVELARSIEKAFIWAYSLRLSKTKVSFDSIEKHVAAHNLFRRLNHCIVPEQFFAIELPLVETIASTKTDRLKTLFRDMKYYEQA